MRIHRGLPIGTLLLLAILLTLSCTSVPLHPGAVPEPASATVNMPPKQVVTEIKRIVSSPPTQLGVTEEREGVIISGYERHRGDFHIGRHWQEQTRYRITVSPDWNDPTSRARIEVSALTEERAAEGQKWEPNPVLYRPDRASAMLEKIMAQLKPAG